MSSDREAAVRSALAQYVDPCLRRDLASAGAIRSLEIADGVVRLAVELGFPAAHYVDDLRQALERQLHAVPGVEKVEVTVGWSVMAHNAQRAAAQRAAPAGAGAAPAAHPAGTPGRPGPGGSSPAPGSLAGVKNIIAVASGKGGVGKSTTAANFAVALAYDGAQVGLLDADIYGPSQPRLMGLTGQRPVTQDGKTFAPLVAHGVKLISIGFLIDEEQPMVWRGPMVSQALTQLLSDTRWGPLDYLIVDMPPGTGDIQLTLSQRVPLSGAVIVTTPQDIALLDARKGLRMFQKVDVPVLGIVENMSTHVCSNCGHEEHIFGAGGGRRMAQQYGVELLAELPLDIRIRQEADDGRPTVAAEPESTIGRAYIGMARAAAAQLAAGSAQAAAFPTISVEET